MEHFSRRLDRYIETDRAYYKKLLALALPVAGQSIITTGVNLVDSLMLGQISEAALSASSQANHFITLFTFCCMGISMGASVLVSRFWGARDMRSLKKAVTIAVLFVLGLASVFTLADILFPTAIMRLYIRDETIVRDGAAYLRWSTVTFLLVGITTVLTNVLRSVGRGSVSMWAAVAAFGVNIGCNYIFIFGKLGAPAMGVAGAALGTVLARIIETAIVGGYFFFADRTVAYRLRDLRTPCQDMVAEFARISIPVMLSDSLLGVGDNVLAMIMGRIGTQFVSANSITVMVQRVSTIFITGIAFGACFLTGQTLGEGKVDSAKKQGWTASLLGASIGIAGGLIIQLIKAPVIGAYNITPETKAVADQLMNAMSVIIVFRAVNSILTKGVLRGGGDTRFLFMADMLTMWGAAIPLGYLAGLVLKLNPGLISVCLYSDQILKTFWCLFRLHSGKWIKKIRGSRSEQTA